MTDKNLPTAEYLHKRLRYEPETGKLFWLDYDEMPNHWRTRWSGREAFTSKNGHGYRQGAINGMNLLAHRVIWALLSGSWPSDDIDHINGNREDNSLKNLRAVSRQENGKNQKLFRTNRSGAVGVCWDKSRSKWMAHITVGQKNKTIGRFDTMEAAIAARSEVSRQHNFSERHGK